MVKPIQLTSGRKVHILPDDATDQQITEIISQGDIYYKLSDYFKIEDTANKMNTTIEGHLEWKCK